MGKRLADIILDKMEDIAYEDSKGHKLTHYVMAERCLQVEMAKIYNDYSEGDYETLTYILEGGFKGFHNMELSELIDEYEGAEETFYTLHEAGGLYVSLYEDDPLATKDPAVNDNKHQGKEDVHSHLDARDHHLINQDFKRMVGKKK
jgi:hypothetical protein